MTGGAITRQDAQRAPYTAESLHKIDCGTAAFSIPPALVARGRNSTFLTRTMAGNRVGRDAAGIHRIKSLLPAGMFEWGLRRRFGLAGHDGRVQ